MGPSIGHIAIALGLMAVGAGLWLAGLRGPHWQGALVAIAWAWSRELAQTWRALDKPGTFTLANVRQAAWPSLAALVIAGGVEVLT